MNHSTIAHAGKQLMQNQSMITPSNEVNIPDAKNNVSMMEEPREPAFSPDYSKRKSVNGLNAAGVLHKRDNNFNIITNI